MKRTIVATVFACVAALCAVATARVIAVQKNATNPLLKEPVRLKQGSIAGPRLSFGGDRLNAAR
jgi:hypothetical protein